VAERYLNALTVRLRGYAGLPMPENLTDEIALQVTVGARVDVEQLAEELREDIGKRPQRVLQSITETDWGASGSGADLIIDVPAVLTGLASLPVLWNTISRRILHRGQARVLDAQTQVEFARVWLAQSLGIGVDTIKIVGLEPVGEGHRVELETPAETFDVEIDGRGVTRMHRR
jgi:hypothetical protein